MIATATATHRVTMPKKMSLFLKRRAKAENTTLSHALVKMMVDAKLYAEEGHIWEEALNNAKTCTGDFVSHADAWK